MINSQLQMIVHIIARDKFTNGYIHFMQSQFPHFDNRFFTTAGSYNVDENDDVVILNRQRDLFLQHLDTLKQAEKIIISGVYFGSYFMLLLYTFGLTSKTYFHFWGNDFYQYRDSQNNKSVKAILARRIVFHNFKNAAGLIFLIDGEYKLFQEITHVSNRHFVAPMCGDPAKIINYAKHRDKDWLSMNNQKMQRPLRVIIGNSATETNHHIEAFEAIQRFKGYPYEVYCPLSYGDEAYRDRVIEAGKALLGEVFHAIVDFMGLEDYMAFLSTMDVGLFFNDRQQAMGNINRLLNFGKKVYMREGTSMWNSYIQRGYHIFAISELKSNSFDEFRFLSEEDWMKNISIYSPEKEAARKKVTWEAVLNDRRKGNL